MIEYEKIKLFLCNTYNKVVGKNILIKEYNNITHSICYHMDDMPSGEKKEELITKFNELNECRWARNKNGAFYISSYNPYRSSNNKLARKISQGLDIISKYGIRLRS